MAESLREERIRASLAPVPHITEFFAHEGGCSLGEAVVILMRLEGKGIASRERKASPYGMTWRRREAG